MSAKNSDSEVEKPLLQDNDVDMEIDEEKFVEKIPYSKAIKDMWKIAPAITIIGYIM